MSYYGNHYKAVGQNGLLAHLQIIKLIIIVSFASVLRKDETLSMQALNDNRCIQVCFQTVSQESNIVLPYSEIRIINLSVRPPFDETSLSSLYEVIYIKLQKP